MTSSEIRKKFLDFFTSKGHTVVPSAPIVLKEDPTLMFTNAGMNQFKEIFLGHSKPVNPRIADTQKCLRVTGKHNDLEDVGVDSYHHTMFEMLGNWSFGDYFKEEAIGWAWELLTNIYQIDKERIYITVFEGDTSEKLEFDTESKTYWSSHVSTGKILNGNKKDNFWEMGDTGPCGPCSEIHVDLRSDEERKHTDGKSLVNKGNPKVIEIWNLVFIEFNRKSDGSLEKLPRHHVDTGMGFERLTMVLQGKQSTYDTDIFSPIIIKIENTSAKKYQPGNGNNEQEKINIAIRVIADHIRAISFAIADGQMPSNTGAGYVIRRILRRAVRYGYQSLNLKEPFLFELTDVLSNQMKNVFPELIVQHRHIKNVIHEEEQAFLRTLEQGLQKFTRIIRDAEINGEAKISGNKSFELYDTYGFPFDLTTLLAKEQNIAVDEDGFKKELEKQKVRSRAAATSESEDWTAVGLNPILKTTTIFSGYESLEEKSRILRYRKVKTKDTISYQVVLDKTPFYAESGGQVGDIGYLVSQDKRYFIKNTIKENNQIIHITDVLPENINEVFSAIVDRQRRIHIADNHTATHLLHAALRQILGKHVEQRGSLVNPDYLRFDFSHFSKVSEEELRDTEAMVNQKIRENIQRQTEIMPLEEARKSGAMALFGEKYGEKVRVVTFDKNYSIELCGGTHVKATGEIGFFKVISETALAAGIRRIEAVTAYGAEQYIQQNLDVLKQASLALKSPKDIIKTIHDTQHKLNELSKQLEKYSKEQGKQIKALLLSKKQEIGDIEFIGEQVEATSIEQIKDICFGLTNEINNLFLIIGTEINGKANLFISISDVLVKGKKWNASVLIKEFSKEINGSGGGQPFYATAGGNKSEGVKLALSKAKNWVEEQL